ncbi:MAG: hypothetical protein JSR67_03615 [Proteobacteria bacterium]|nr:hypothetical protein [Pseudomonadota bacterium]
MGGGGQVTGYQYWLGLHFGLCHGPVDSLLEIRCGQRTAWSGNQASSGFISVNNPNLFGGDKREGGVKGTAALMMGESTQVANAYLTSKQGAIQPAYRGVTTLVWQGGQISSNNPYPKPWSFRVRRATAGWQGGSAWYSAKAAITLSSGVVGMNPAHIVYEALTNSDWGLGYPAAQIDTVNFQAAADQLYSEGFGLCLLWSRMDTIEAFIQSIMDYIDGVLVSSRTTGLFQLMLLRGGYSIPSLPVIGPDNVLEMQQFDAATINGATNEVVITYNDPRVGGITYGGKQAVAVQALGAVQAQGVVVTQKTDYPGIATADLALRVAQRELAKLSTALKHVQMKVDRTAWNFIPGSLFVLNFPAYGISQMVMRVATLDFGTVAKGEIQLAAIQDVFSLPTASYVAAPVTGWTPPSSSPAVPTLYLGLEASYRDIDHNLASALPLPAAAAYVYVAVARPNGLQLNWQFWSYVSPATPVKHGVGHFTPTAQIAASIGPFDTAITLNSGIDLSLVSTATQAIIVDTQIEVVRVDAIDPVAMTATIARGCVDTVPAAHAAGSRIFFLDGPYGGSDQIQYFSGETVDVAPATVTGWGVLPEASAPVIPIAMIGRANMPYPPAYMTINGTRFDLVSTVTGAFTVAWRERNRLTQADQLIDQTAATVTPETGTSYVLKVYDNGTNTLLTTYTPSGTSQVVNVGANYTLRLELQSIRGGVTSWQKQIAIFTFTNASTGILTEASANLDTESSSDLYTE